MQANPHRFASTLLGLFCGATFATAQSGPPPIPVELRARFGFTGPLITKIGDGIGTLRIADIDGDGRVEAVVVDARRARLVAVRCDGQQTTTEAISTDGQITGYALADVNGDGKANLLLVDSRGRLRIAGIERLEIDLGLGARGVGMLTGDLDGDGKADLVAFSRSNLRWISHLDGDVRLSPIEAIEENAHSFDLFDVDGDGHLDIVFVVGNTNMNLRLRAGRGDGTFGPWHIAGVDNLLHLFPARFADGSRALATIQGPNRRVALQRYAEQGGQAALEWWPFGETSSRTLPFALGDLDGDRVADLAVVLPERAQLQVFTAGKPTYVVRALPTLAGVASLAIGDVDGDGKPDLVLASPEEDALSWMSGALPLDEFPAQIACVDKPVAATVDPNGGVLVIARTERRDAHLDRVVPGGEPQRLADLGRLPADPVRLIAADVGDGDGLEVSFVVPGEGLRSITIGAEQKQGGKSGDAAGFTKKMDDGALALCVHDGQPALLAARERFVREFRIDRKGQVHVLAQDNGPDGLAEISLAAAAPGGARLYLDKKSNKLVRTAPGAAPTSIEVPPFDFNYLLATDDAALLLSPRGVLRVPFGNGPTLQAVVVHEPPTERTFYWEGHAGDFDHDGVQDLAVLDRQLPGLQILAGGRDANGRDHLDRALAVPVFETGPSSTPGNEPREMDVGDLDGDGRTDIVVVAHDRVLIYLQQK
ncbi:MAG TPA: VCBS repeat-containing protein [Planctomycetota bacterium]|nr:VCBS repeat-containing protein [Planctomycetota bacterium]